MKLKINRGTTYTITYNHKVDGVATTLVGATVRFTLKSVEWDTDANDNADITQAQYHAMPPFV